MINTIFYKLPDNIVNLIYEYSGNWKDKYNETLKRINKVHFKYDKYDEENDDGNSYYKNNDKFYFTSFI